MKPNAARQQRIQSDGLAVEQEAVGHYLHEGVSRSVKVASKQKCSDLCVGTFKNIPTLTAQLHFLTCDWPVCLVLTHPPVIISTKAHAAVHLIFSPLHGLC